MKTTRRPAALIAATLLTATVAACSKNTGEKSARRADTGDALQNRTSALVNDAVGPIAPLPGAKPGGTITLYYNADLEHIDPAQNYVNISQVLTQLLYRTLTSFRERPTGGFDLVGDLATNTGVTNDSGKTWTYTLRDGLKYEDGRPVTSQDIAYGIARSFSPNLPNGAHYIQQWLANDINYNKDYKGPYDGGATTPPGVETPDAKTIVFHFKVPRPEMPFAVTMPNASPVPKDKDTRQNYDNRPFSSGPYKIGVYQRGQRLVLVKNPQWDPRTDPIRTQNPDTVQFVFTNTGLQTNERLIADQGPDAAAISYNTVNPELIPKVLGDPSARKRIVEGITIFNRYLAINTQRVKDLKVRQALNWALDRENFLKVYGPRSADPGTTILSPTVMGYQKYDAYPGGPTGNIAKAKELLGGKTVPLIYAYANTPTQQKIAAQLKTNLDQAGFQLTLQPVDGAQYYTTINKRSNPYDIYQTGWGADWPSGSTVIPPILDGRTLAAEGNQDNSYLNEPSVNAKIDSISAVLDLNKAAVMWSALDKYIMENFAPFVPLTYERSFALIGSRVGGAYLSTPYGITGLTTVFVK